MIRSRQLRKLFITLLIGLGIAFATNMPLGWSLLIFISVTLFLALTYVIFAAVPEANSALKKGNLAQAENSINSTHPRLLLPRAKARYFFVKGLLAAQKQDNSGLITNLENALALRLDKPNDRGLALVHLIKAAYENGTTEKAIVYFKQLQDTKLTDLRLKDQRAHWGKILGNVGFSKN